MSKVSLQGFRTRLTAIASATAMVGAVMVGSLLTASPAAAAPLSNGSFETPVIGPSFVTFGTTTPAGPNIGPWTVVPPGETVDLIKAPFPVSDGLQAIEIIGDTGPGAGVQQTFDTVSGTAYVVTYDVAGRCSGNLRTTINGAQVDTVSVAAGQPYATRTVPFTATGPSTTLLFDSSVSGAANCGALLDNVTVALAPAGTTCGYGTGGPSASSLCWFDLTNYNDATARSVAGQPTSINLPGGYVASFTLTSRPVGALPHSGVVAQATPLEDRFAFGSSGADGGYRGVPGKPALYSFGSGGVNLTLSNITVVDSGGQPVTGYRFVIADAENNINGENFTFTSDKPLNLLGVLNDDAPAGCNVPPNNLAGLGTTTVTCTGSGNDSTPPPNPLYDAVVVAADTPSTIGLSLTTQARSGVAFAIQTSKIQVTKSVLGRAQPTDSFDVSATSPEGTIIGSATTGPSPSVSATTGELTVLPRTNGTFYTLSDAVTPGSGTQASDYTRNWVCTNNGQAYPAQPSASGTSIQVSPVAGDDIECTVTNSVAAAGPGAPVTCTGATGHKVEFRKSTTSLGNLAASDSVLAAPVTNASVTARAFDDGRPVINYLDSGIASPPLEPSPTLVSSSELLLTTKGTFNAGLDNNFAMRSSGLLVIPTAGTYTFTVESDDGERLQIGTPLTTVTQFAGVRAIGADTGTVNFAAAGCYPYQLDWFNGGGPAGVDFLASGPGIATPTLVGAPGGIQVLQGATRAPVSKPAVLAASVNWSFGAALATGTPIVATATYGNKPLVGLIGDWDGNGTETLGTFEQGVFQLNNANDSSEPDITFTFGDPRAYAVAGDFDGNGTDDVALYRAGNWQVHYLGAGAPADASFSLTTPFATGTYPNTIPVAGDWDGDGIDGIGTYNLANGQWVLKNTVGAGAPDIGPFTFWAGFGSVPVVGDWTGIGVDTPGYRIGTNWTVRTSGNPPTPTTSSQFSFDFGVTNSVPFAWR